MKERKVVVELTVPATAKQPYQLPAVVRLNASQSKGIVRLLYLYLFEDRAPW